MRILILGGGVAGLYAALDATLRGAQCTLVEKGRVGSGTSSKATGMLHSGARYLVSDPTVAELCWQESPKFKKNFSFAKGLEPGLFLIYKKNNPSYIKTFENNAKRIGININKVGRDEVLALEPNINQNIVGAYLTPDTPFRPALVIEALKERLQKLRANILENTSVKTSARKDSAWQVTLQDQNHVDYKVTYDVVINATGSWAAEVIKTFGGSLKLIFAHGAVAVFNTTPIKHVVSVAGENKPGDVLIPGKQTFNVGATWELLKTPKPGPIQPTEIEALYSGAHEILPSLNKGDYLTGFKGVRTHLGYESAAQKRFGISRNFMIVDHEILDGQPNLYTVLAGKFVLGRLMAEKLIDKIFKKNAFVPSRTGEYPLD